MNGSVTFGAERSFLEPLGAWFADGRELGAGGRPGEVIATTHLWESKDDVLRELFTLLCQCQAVEA
jgi:hypothetical protein